MGPSLETRGRWIFINFNLKKTYLYPKKSSIPLKLFQTTFNIYESISSQNVKFSTHEEVENVSYIMKKYVFKKVTLPI